MAVVVHVFILWRRVSLTLGVLSLVVCQAATATSSTPETARSPSELQGQIEEVVSHPRFEGALWGIKVASLDTGRTWVEHAPTLRLSPASNSKLYTSALALDTLGGDYRIKTPLLASSPVDQAGVLKGDVIISGRGDPSWNSRAPKGDFWATFEPFIAILQQANVRRITGDIVADATYFRSTPYGAGWSVTDLNDYYGAEISAITLEDNYADLRVTAATELGAPCTIERLHPHTGLLIENRTATFAENGKPHINVLRLPGENTVHIFGGLPLGGKEELTESTVPRPAGWFAAALKAALVRRGIRVDGSARDVRWPEATAVTARSITLGEVISPPLRDLVTTLLKASQNLHTDLLFAHLGEARRTSTTPAWVTSDELAVHALNDFLQRNSLRANEVIFEEGSGLSRNNLTTAAATVRLLQFMATHRDASVFSSALPIAGVDGTLRRRMKGTSAEGNVHAKTGTLRWANSLSGFVTTASGEHLVFSLMLNRYAAPVERNAQQELDEIAERLAAYAGSN